MCNEKFNKILDLKNHIILNCISIDFNNNIINNNVNNIDNNIVNNIDNTVSNIDNNTVNNIDNNTFNNIVNNIDNINNNSTINSNNSIINGDNNIINNIHVYCPISFDDNWDISHLSNEDKNLLIVSMVKYTKTLEYLLKNKSNHNVLIDKESNSGLVYKNNNIEKMTLEEICDKSFDKIYDHLNKFYDNSKNINVGSIDPEYIDNQKKSMKLKYFNYKDSQTNNKILANKSILEIFNKVKNETLENFNKIDKLKDNIGY